MNTLVAVLLIAAAPAFAHRLDEYLQAALISVESGRVQVQMTLTPGVLVAPALLSAMDGDSDGMLSEMEQRAYAGGFLRDLSLTLDGRPIRAQLTSMKFPAPDDMKQGLGEIQFTLEADLPSGTGARRLGLENRHQDRISAYQVNCLVPGDPHIRIAAQHRNFTQSLYQVDYEDTGSRPPIAAALALLSPFAVLLLTRFAYSQRQR